MESAIARVLEARKTRCHELTELGERSFRMNIAVSGGKPVRRVPEAGKKYLVNLTGRFIFVFKIKAVDEFRAFLVRKSSEVCLAIRMVSIPEYLGRRPLDIKHMVAHDVAHKADVNEVDGIERRFAHT